VTPDPLSSTNIRTGKITSINSAKSKMGVYYGERELARSDDEIAFGKVDLIVPQGPGTNGGTPLPEDRQPAGGTAPATNEVNPGTIVLLLPQDQTNRVATTLTLKADPTGGSVTLDQHGLDDLKIYTDEALQQELPIPKTWADGETSPTTLYMVGSSSSTNLQSAQGTLDLTYKANLAANGGEYFVKDTVGVNLLPVQISEVSFGGDKYWELWADDCDASNGSQVPADKKYSSPQWKDVDGNEKPTNTAQGERDYAVAFTRNTKPKIGAKFKISGASIFGAIKIKATGPGGVAIPETTATVSGDVVTLPNDTEASAALVNTIKFYDKKEDAKAFKLEWEVKIGNSDWSKIGTTKHTVYVLLADPITSLRQETLADLGCRNANDESAEASSRDKMYAEFTDRVVKRLDGKQMTYWLNDQQGATATADLLSRPDGNGNCESWSGLFRDVLRFQGIQADRIKVGPQANDEFVAVKTWTFTEPPHGPSNHPYVIGRDATDLNGVPGQGNTNPPGAFNGHWITESGGVYFDPSYGAASVSGASKGKLYEDGAFSGFGATYELPNNGGQFDSIRKNDTSAQSPAEVDYSEAN
jgi:hypothetical protein